jgi:phosphatidylglycerophosphatase A
MSLKEMFKLDAIISTFFGIGKFPFMPGTVASAVTVILVFVLFFQPHMVTREGVEYVNMGGGYINPNYIIYILILSTLFSYIFGVKAADSYSKRKQKSDPGYIVIDEVAGVLVSFSLISFVFAGLLYFNENEFKIYLMISYWFFPVVFILFRIFDIFKPWHVGRCDKKYHGGFGIMIDDIVAGVYTAISFFAIFFALKYAGILDKMISV